MRSGRPPKGGDAVRQRARTPRADAERKAAAVMQQAATEVEQIDEGAKVFSLFGGPLPTPPPAPPAPAGDSIALTFYRRTP